MNEKQIKIAVLVSGGGTNLQALIDAETAGMIGAGKLALVISSNEKAYALERAARHGIPAITMTAREYGTPGSYDSALLGILSEHGIELVVLAGYLKIIGEKTLTAYIDRIINVHPSLIPSFCGEGYYGLKVHEAALDYGVKVTGATVHHVSGVVDGGKIILQKAVEIEENDTPESLQKRVMEQAEWELLPRAVSMLCDKIANTNCDKEMQHEKQKGANQCI